MLLGPVGSLAVPAVIGVVLLRRRWWWVFGAGAVGLVAAMATLGV